MPLVLLFLALAVYVPTASKDLVITDNQAAAASAWRIATTGRPWMEGVSTADFKDTKHADMWLVTTPDGHIVHNRTAGVILAGVPFYWALNNESDVRQFEIWVGGVAAAFFTAVGGVLLFLGLRSKFEPGVAFASTAVVLFATPVWSVSANALWTHNLTILGIAGAIWSATHSRWLRMGMFFAVGIFARPHLAVIAAVVGVYLGWRRRDWRITVSTGVTSAFGLLMLIVWNRAVFGAWSISGGYGDYVSEALVSGPSAWIYEFGNLVGFLLAPDRGLLAWTPLILLLLPAMLAGWRDLPDWVRAFVIAGALYSLVQLRINSFQGGEGFYGYRLALELLICMTPALISAYLRTARATRVISGGLVGIQFAAIAIGSAADKYYIEDSDMWITSAFLQALGDRPLMFGALTAVCGFLGAVLMLRAAKRTGQESPTPLPV